MSRVELREAWRDSPDRARSFCTVRAAISRARPGERPCCLSLFFMCSYWRARLVPFLTPLGGIVSRLLVDSFRSPVSPLTGFSNGAAGSGQPPLPHLACGVAREGVEKLDLAR